MAKPKLINKKITKAHLPLLFEQYKLFVESAEKTSEHRDSANQFYLALNTAIISISGYLVSINQTNIIYTIIPVVGIIVNWYWHDIIHAFRKLNSKKFVIINQLESFLPVNLFNYEWHLLGEGKTKNYKPITHIEKCIPKVFIVLYILIILILNFSFILYLFHLFI